ncbi:MAG TPA: MarR family transcriptional regulator [Acidimicrobiia bacterium]|nr:MarR family transcriptional regulator [Acidimicrobiia bacterium]
MPPRRGPLKNEDLDAVIAAVLRATPAFVGVALRSLAAAGVDVTLAQYRMLAVLDREAGRNVRDLAARLGVERSTATRMCDRLVRAHLIERRTDPSDRRAVAISLTAEGHEVVAKVTTARRAIVAELLRPLPPDRRQQLVGLLDEFAGLVERNPGPEGPAERPRSV